MLRKRNSYTVDRNVEWYSNFENIVDGRQKSKQNKKLKEKL